MKELMSQLSETLAAACWRYYAVKTHGFTNKTDEATEKARALVRHFDKVGGMYERYGERWRCGNCHGSAITAQVLVDLDTDEIEYINPQIESHYCRSCEQYVTLTTKAEPEAVKEDAPRYYVVDLSLAATLKVEASSPEEAHELAKAAAQNARSLARAGVDVYCFDILNTEEAPE